MRRWITPTTQIFDAQASIRRLLIQARDLIASQW